MLADIKGAIDVAKTLLGMVRDENAVISSEKTEALAALMAALVATRQYLSSPPVRDGQFDNQAEDQLTRLWMAASNAVRPIDDDLAMRCFMKAYGWADRAQFDTPAFQELRIDLDDIADDIRLIIKD